MKKTKKTLKSKSGFSKEDLGIVTFPFILTALLVVMGYQILIKQTPEARISIPKADTTVEIIRSGDSGPIPAPPESANGVQMVIANLPQNSSQLSTLIDRAKTNGANAVYLSLPITMSADHSLKVDFVDQSSQDNVDKWLRKTTIELHKAGLRTLVAFTINSSTTVSDFPTFYKNYMELMKSDWIKTIAAYNVSFFFPGITMGHPLYTELTPAQMRELVVRTNQTLRTNYQGEIGIGLCCRSEIPTNYLFGYNFALVIPNQDAVATVLSPIAEKLKTTHNFSHTFYYKRDNMTATTNLPQ